MARNFSTGFPPLDRLVGGPSDSLLAFASDSAGPLLLAQKSVEHALSARFPILYLAIDGSLERFFLGNPKAVLKIRSRRDAQNVSKIPARGYVFIDDLTAWKKILGSEKRVVEFYEKLALRAESKKSLLIASAIRSGFAPESLARLKDASAIGIDFLSHQGKIFCVVNSLRGRYLPPRLVPLQLEAAPPALTSSAVEAGELSPKDEALISRKTDFSKIFEQSDEAMILFDPATTGSLLCNSRFEEFLGFSAEELALNPLAPVPPEGRRAALRFYSTLRRKKKGAITLRLVKKSGRGLLARFSASAVDHVYLGIAIDVSAEKRLEESHEEREREYRALLDSSPHALAIMHEGSFLYTNRAFCELFGYPFGELKAPGELLVLKKLRESGSIETEGTRKDGSRFTARVTRSSVTFAGKKSVQVSVADITQERELALTITRAQRRFGAIVESSPEAAAILAGDALVFTNSAFRRLLGYGEEAIPLSMISPDPQLFEKLRKRPGSARFAGQRKDGSTFDAEVSLHPAGDKESVVLIRDRTTELRTAETLSRQTEEFDLLGRLIPDLQGSLDIKKLPATALLRLIEHLSWGGGALFLADEKGKELFLETHRTMPESVLRKLEILETDEGIGGFCAKTQEAHIFTIAKYPKFLPYGALFAESGITEICLLPLVSGETLTGLILLVSKKPPLSRKESHNFLSAISRNLGAAIATARALQKIRNSAERKEQLIESSPEILYTASPTGAFLTVNSTVERLTGYPPKEFYRNPSLWMKLVHPDDKKLLLERTANLDRMPENSWSEYRVLPRGKAAYRWVRDVVSTVRDEQLFGTITDVTEQKGAISELQTGFVLQSEILSGMDDGVVAFDRSLRCVSWNSAMERMTGVTGAVGQSASALLPGYHEAGLAKILGRVLAGETVTSPDVAYRHHATGQQGFFLGRFSPMRNSDGDTVGAVGIIVDVSAHKSVETEMRESEQILSNVIDTMGDLLTITDLQGTILQVNRAFLRGLGYSRAEAVGREFPYPWLIESEMGRFVLWTSNLRERNSLHDFDMTWRTKDGRLIPMSLSTTLLRNSLGEPVAMLNVARDITQRTRQTRDLETRNSQIEMINRIISRANQTLDFDEIFGVIAGEIFDTIPADLVGIGLLDEGGSSIRSYAFMGRTSYIKDNRIPIGQTVSQIVLESGKPVIVSDFHADPKYRGLASFVKGLRSQISMPIRVKEAIIGTLNVGSKEPHVYSDDHIGMLEPVVQQSAAILDRIGLINQVSDDAAYIHNLLDSIDSIVYTVDTQLRIREVNKAFHDLMAEFGETPRNYHGTPLFDVIRSEPLRVMVQNVVDELISGRVRLFSQEYVQPAPGGDRTFQLMITPMVIDRKVTGLVFTHTDITALKKTELDLKRSNEQLLSMNEISTVISTFLDLDEILDEAVPLLAKMTAADAAAVYLREEDSGDLALAVQVGFDSETSSLIQRLSAGTSATGEVMKRRKALYVGDDIAEDERIIPANREILRRNGMRALAVVPLMSKDRVLGALDILYRAAHSFSDQEQQILALVGNQLGAAIENAQLYAELRSQLKRLTVLYELSQHLTSTLNIEEIFQVAYEHIRRVIPFKKLSIDLYDSAQNMKTPIVRVEQSSGERIFVPAQPVAIDPLGPEGSVVQSKRSYTAPDHRSISIPMMSKESIIGIMTAEADEFSLYDDRHLKLLESIGNLTAIALEKGKLYEETLQKSLEIERRNRELDDFTYVVSHDLKEPLISIEGFSRILQSDYQHSIGPEGKEYFESIVGATTRMKGLIDDLLLLSRVSRPSESFKNVSLRDIIEEIKVDMEFTIRQKGVTLTIPGDMPEIFGNETQLKIVFRNLIGNAIKFNKGPQPRVEIGFQNAENNSYLFSVRDNGIGIEKEFHEKIFVIFQRLHRREDYEGSGAGLAIVKKIIELHKGKIWVESEPGIGSVFYFTIPRPLAAE